MRHIKRYFIYLIFYSVGGWVLERIINLIAYGEWLDNSVLVGPYQPLYGSGVVLTIISYELIVNRLELKQVYKELVLLGFAIVFTAIVEATTGFGYQAITGRILWDYRETFPCQLPFVCVIPTTLFGILSYLVVRFLHPIIKAFLENLHKVLLYALFGIFMIDIIVTLTNLLS